MQDQSKNIFRTTFQGETLELRADGTLYWPREDLLCVSDLHLGKAQRYAMQGGAGLPPYDVQETLDRLDRALEQTGARHVICLGDSFDTMQARQDLDPDAEAWITRLQAGRRWVWMEGNHDPGPIHLGGSHLAHLDLAPMRFVHIAQSDVPNDIGEISGHYHPKLRLPLKGRSLSRPCFVVTETRLILPAFGLYTGGLSVQSPAFPQIIGPQALYVMTGDAITAIPHAALMRL